MNKSFQPTATDIASYVHVIDRNRNGKVTVDELENFIIRYFFNPNRGWYDMDINWFDLKLSYSSTLSDIIYNLLVTLLASFFI